MIFQPDAIGGENRLGKAILRIMERSAVTA